jgi:hypothetical protein
MIALLFLLSSLLLASGLNEFIDFEKIGGIPEDGSLEMAFQNGRLFNDTLNKLESGDTLFVSNKTFTLSGGIKVRNLKDVTFQIDGTIRFVNDRDSWPKNAEGNVEECIYMEDIENIVFTSSGKGTIDGNGKEWWGAIKFLKFQEDRPRILHIRRSKNVLVENLLLKDSPYWTFWAEQCDGMHIHHTDVSARWTDIDKHTLLDLQAFNTDGFDITGKNVYIHDCWIWNQDDCISVKDGSEDMLFERITCSGLGLVVGSIGSSRVNNITFRDSYMPNTFKGIYMKTRWSDSGPIGDAASISNVLYENITMDNPEQYAVWIGPAQQTGQPCSLLWTKTPHAECKMSGYQTWSNITLRNIFINNPTHSPGVLMGNSTYPMHNVSFVNVVVRHPGDEPFGTDYFCEGIEGVSKGLTNPEPTCFDSSKKNKKNLRA